MIVRRETLAQALDQVRAGALKGASVVIVSRTWWDALSAAERDTYRIRADQVGIGLRVDDTMSSHFVEIRGADGGSLSTEHPT